MKLPFQNGPFCRGRIRSSFEVLAACLDAAGPFFVLGGNDGKKAKKKTGCFGFIGNTLQGTNISHLGKLGKSSSKVPLKGDMLVPRRVVLPSFYRDYDTVGQGVIQ